MPDRNINILESDIEACHRFSKPGVRLKSKKIIVSFVSRKSCNEIVRNKKKLAKLNNEKQNLWEGTKLFISETLTPMNESIAFNCRKLKCKEFSHSCYSRNGVTNIRMTYKRLPVKIFQMERLVSKYVFRFWFWSWRNLWILMPLFIQPTNFKSSSLEWIISGLGVLIMHQGTFI